jgi:hypothetical protein
VNDSGRALLLVVSFLLASPLEAGVTIAAASPTPDQPVSSTSVTVTVSCSSDAAPLRLKHFTLTVTNHAAGVPGSLTTTGSSATFTSSSSLVGGTLQVQASIADQSESAATASQAYEVLPTLQALSLATGLAGDLIVVGGQGLDANPARNALVFHGIPNRERHRQRLQDR